MAPSLKGKTAFITGGAAGIGKAVTEALLERGIKVCISDVDVSTGAETLKELQSKHGGKNVMFIKCDVTSEKEIEECMLAAIKKFGHLDIMINNAGTVNESNWKLTMDINLNGVIRGTLLAFKHLSDSEGKKGGTVINTASVAAFRSAAVVPAYCASKFAVSGWTKSWGDELNVKRTGVKVCAVCPDATDTALLKTTPKQSVDSAATAQLFDSIKTLLQPADIAKGFIKVLEDEVSGVLLCVTLKKELVYIENEKYEV